MRVIKFYSEDYYYAFAAETFELAQKEFHSQIGDTIERWEEVPESEWDKEEINLWVDNDFTSKPSKVSIRQLIICTDPQLIFTDDLDIIS